MRCESCEDEILVAFSCKGRGVCPSCNAKRAQVTAVHLVEGVLPHVPYRRWTLSFPHRVRWVLLKEKGLLSDILTLFPRAVFALQRRRARRQGVRGGQTGAVSSESSPGAPCWKASLFTPTRTCMPMTGRGWSGCAAMGRAVRWRLSVCRERRTAASRTG
ncbi:transposase zinc-binding domain-containing protein [Archangium sp.]|uniref:transposase zinc-binding domain-containing protein n=1 Tax=Archangium sp. TaxID=1872627 RepID=UPI0039C89B5C